YDPASRIGVGYVPERLGLPAAMTLGRYLRTHAALIGLAGAAAGRAVGAAAETTGVGLPLRERAGGLSQGRGQRGGLARAPRRLRDARDWIQAARARGATLLVSSHVLSEVERTCEQVVILHEGRVAAAGPLDAVVAPGESLEDAFVRAVRG